MKNRQVSGDGLSVGWMEKVPCQVNDEVCRWLYVGDGALGITGAESLVSGWFGVPWGCERVVVKDAWCTGWGRRKVGLAGKDGVADYREAEWSGGRC